jgi:hypothetical protein
MPSRVPAINISSSDHFPMRNCNRQWPDATNLINQLSCPIWVSVILLTQRTGQARADRAGEWIDLQEQQSNH